MYIHFLYIYICVCVYVCAKLAYPTLTPDRPAHLRQQALVLVRAVRAGWQPTRWQ